MLETGKITLISQRSSSELKELCENVLQLRKGIYDLKNDILTLQMYMIAYKDVSNSVNALCVTLKKDLSRFDDFLNVLKF